MNLSEVFKTITTFVFDMDGVLTDGKVIAFANGELVRTMSIRDGYALQLARKKGYRIAIISGSGADGVQLRLAGLGIQDVFMRVENKLQKLDEYLREHALRADEVLFMGDDIPDLEVMKYCGLSAAPADAVPEIRAIAAYISTYKGGEGCVRDILEKILKVRGDWHPDTQIASR